MAGGACLSSESTLAKIFLTAHHLGHLQGELDLHDDLHILQGLFQLSHEAEQCLEGRFLARRLHFEVPADLEAPRQKTHSLALVAVLLEPMANAEKVIREFLQEPCVTGQQDSTHVGDIDYYFAVDARRFGAALLTETHTRLQSFFRRARTKHRLAGWHPLAL